MILYEYLKKIYILSIPTQQHLVWGALTCIDRMPATKCSRSSNFKICISEAIWLDAAFSINNCSIFGKSSPQWIIVRMWFLCSEIVIKISIRKKWNLIILFVVVKQLFEWFKGECSQLLITNISFDWCLHSRLKRVKLASLNLAFWTQTRPYPCFLLDSL